MIRVIFKQIWNQRRQNSWIFLELLIAGFFLWSVVDPVYVLFSNMQISPGYVEGDSYVVSLGMYPKMHSKYNIEYDEDLLKQTDFLKVFNRINALPEVESSVILENRCFPNSSSYYGNKIYRDSSRISCQEYRFSTINGGNMLKVMQLRDAYSGELIQMDSVVHAGKRAYITKNIAVKLFGNEYPVGKEVMSSDSSKIIIAGVVDNIRDRINNQPRPILIRISPEMYDVDNWVSPQIYFRVKNGVNPKLFKESFRKEVAATLKVGNFYLKGINSLTDIRNKYMNKSGVNNIFRLKLSLASFALLCIFLGMVGTFWIRSNARRQEIGLMKAMGCTTSQIVKQFFIESWLLLSLAFVPAMLAQLHFIHENGFAMPAIYPDPEYLQNQPVAHFLIVTLIIYAILLFTVFIGTYIPVYKAAKASPAEALRDE